MHVRTRSNGNATIRAPGDNTYKDGRAVIPQTAHPRPIEIIKQM